jgi:selenocysteine lyase/cysteine desulfurase
MNKPLEAIPPAKDARALFDIQPGVVYLNAASKSAIPLIALEAGRTGVRAKAQPWAIDEPARYTQADHVRALFADLIGATASDIAIHPAASYGIATAVRQFSPTASSQIILLEGQFPSNVYAWRRLAAETGADIITVPTPDDDDWTAAVLSAISERTSIAALPPVHWVDGTVLNLEKIGAALKNVDAAFVVDATQWVGVQPLDVRAIQADFVVCAAYKWLLGPYGMSLMYAAPKYQNGVPLEEHLFNKGGVASITGGLGYTDDFSEGAMRYDAGEYLNLITIPMLEASLRQINAWGPAHISARLAPITAHIADGAQTLGLKVAPAQARCPHIITLRRDGGFPAETVPKLDALGVYVSARGGHIRVSPYIFNEESDANRFLNSLESVLR